MNPDPSNHHWNDPEPASTGEAHHQPASTCDCGMDSEGRFDAPPNEPAPTAPFTDEDRAGVRRIIDWLDEQIASLPTSKEDAG